MTDEAWNAPSVRSLGVLMVGDALDEIDERGRPVRGDTVLILLNAHHEEEPFTLPSIAAQAVWRRVLDTVAPHVPERRYHSDCTYPLQGRTLAVFVLSVERRERSAATQPAKGSAIDIPDEPSAGYQHLLARSARLGPLCGSQRVQNSRNEPQSGPTHEPATPR